MIVASELERPSAPGEATATASSSNANIWEESQRRVPLPWILRLRFGMIVGEAAVVAAVAVGLQVSLPYAVLAVPLAVQVLTNVLLARLAGRLQRNLEHVVGGLFCLDALCLTGILAATGGPNNPFSLLYLVQITFSAIILHRAWTWALGILSTLCFGLMFWVSRDIPALHAHTTPGEFSVHLLGMWIAFAAAALLISFFIATVSSEARRKDLELLSMQKRLHRNERLASLVTLAAGAAHEMATPLSTIAVTAKEIEHHAGSRLRDKPIEEDATLIRSQVERCRLILERMGAQGADPLGEAPRRVRCADLLAAVRSRFPSAGERILIEAGGDAWTCRLPEKAAVEAIAALTKNALDASPEDAPVILSAIPDGDTVRFTVRDRGAGMSPQVLDRVTEPFFTTKPAGRGMGLGAFLVHLFAERLGGSLSFESVPGRGTTCFLEIPNRNHVQK